MVVLFLLSVMAIVLAVDLAVGLVYLVTGDAPAGAGLAGVPRGAFAAGALVTIGIIAAVSLWNIIGLAGGGAKVARMLGGRKVAPDTREPLERRFLNIVEEMAIASGVRVPEAWVMDGEKGINAFAAGWTVSGAVVSVTRGTLERLTRDELQGVIGHEFSHILNGDMGLNIRMIGVLAGIVAIGSIGSFLMRMAGEADDIRGAAPLLAAGLALFIIGYAGLFFARLIKAAVSRQREFLADASSVQFTRNPDGIAGALDQIRASPGGALIRGRYAEDMSHLFFGQGIEVTLSALFDTHPPVDERIRRVNPRFQPSTYRKARAAAPEVQRGETAPPAGRRAGDIAQLVGALIPEKLSYAERLNWKKRFLRLGLQPTFETRLVAVRRKENRLEASLVNQISRKEMRIAIDQVIVEQGSVPMDQVYFDLRNQSANDGVTDLDALAKAAPQPRLRQTGFELHRIGDAVSSRNIHAAVLDAMRICSAL